MLSILVATASFILGAFIAKAVITMYRLTMLAYSGALSN